MDLTFAICAFVSASTILRALRVTDERANPLGVGDGTALGEELGVSEGVEDGVGVGVLDAVGDAWGMFSLRSDVSPVNQDRQMGLGVRFAEKGNGSVRFSGCPRHGSRLQIPRRSTADLHPVPSSFSPG